MEENLHEIDKLFRIAIDEHEEAPSQNVWNGIRNELNENPVVFSKQKNNNRRYLALLLILLLGIIGYNAYRELYHKKEIVFEKKIYKTNDQQKVIARSNNLNNKSALTGNSLKNKEMESASNEIKNTDSPNPGIQQLLQANEKVNKPAASKKTTMVKIKSVKKEMPSGQINANKVNTQTAKEFANENKIPLIQNHSYPTTDRSSTRIIPGRIKANLVPINLAKAPASNIKITDQLFKPVIAAGLKKSTAAKASHSFHFTLMPLYSQQVTFSHLENEHHEGRPDHDNDRDKIKAGEQHQTSSSVGILAEMPVAKKWSIQSGISYSTMNIDILPKKVFAEKDQTGDIKYRFDCSTGYSYLTSKNGATPAIGDSAEVSASSSTLKYLTVPVSINYRLSAGKFNIVPTIGFAINSIVKQEIKTELVAGPIKEKQAVNVINGLRPNYFSVFAGVALEYSLNSRVAINFLPSVNLALSSANKDVQVRSYYNSMSLAGGVKIKF